MAADLPYKRGPELIKEYREKHGDVTLLGFSRGKDSISAALALRGKLRIVPIFFFAIPGLPMIEEGLRYYERTLFDGERIRQFPEGAFYKWLTAGVYQTPGTMEVIRAADIKTFTTSTHGEWWRQITRWVIEDEALPKTTLAATGVRARDSPMRWLNVKKNGVIRPSAINWLPVWHYTKGDVVNSIAASGVSLPIDYHLFGRSFGGGLDARFLVPLKRHRPEDFKIVLEWFPMAELAVWKYERFIEGKKHA